MQISAIKLTNMNKSSMSLRNERNALGVLGTLIRFALLFGCRCQLQHRLYRVHGEGLSQALRSNRVDRSTTKGVQYIVLDCIAVHVVDAAACNENQEKERKRKSLRRTTRKSRRGKRKKGKEKRLSRCGELQRVAQKEAIARHT